MQEEVSCLHQIPPSCKCNSHRAWLIVPILLVFGFWFRLTIKLFRRNCRWSSRNNPLQNVSSHTSVEERLVHFRIIGVYRSAYGGRARGKGLQRVDIICMAQLAFRHDIWKYLGPRIRLYVLRKAFGLPRSIPILRIRLVDSSSPVPWL